MNDKQVAAVYGHQYIPYFRKLRARKKELKMNHYDLMSLVKRSEFVEWDFANSLGDTIMEKYEALYLTCLTQKRKLEDAGEICNVLIGSPETTSIFEIRNSHGWWPERIDDPDFYLTTRTRNWDVYKDVFLEKNFLIVTQKELEKAIVVKIENFVI